jgi:hypothetical protein
LPFLYNLWNLAKAFVRAATREKFEPGMPGWSQDLSGE